MPWGSKSFKDLIFQIVQSKAEVKVRERVFYELFDNVVFYVNSTSSNGEVMKDLFVVDRRNPSKKRGHPKGQIGDQAGFLGSHIITRPLTTQRQNGSIWEQYHSRNRAELDTVIPSS